MRSRFQVLPSARPPRRLPRSYQREGFVLRQVWRRGTLAVYSQALDGDIVAYEVYLVRVRPAMMLKGKLYPRREVIPRNEEWGRRAWTCPTLEEARRKCEEIDHASSLEVRLVSRIDA